MVDDDDDKPPHCFGEEYDAAATECCGGYDPAYFKDGSRIRAPCKYKDSCCDKQARTKQAHVHVPVGSVVRPTQFTVQQPYRPPTSFTAPRPVWGSSAQPQTASPVSNPHQTYQPQQYAAHAPPQPQYVQQLPQQMYQQMMPVNYGMPQYLTSREPLGSGELMERLLREILRSIGKALGHTIANFFDTEVIGRPPRP